MPAIIPLNDDGNREITVDTLGGGVYRFRSYYSQGVNGRYDGWFVDIADSVGSMLLRGIRIVPGCPNLLKGQGDNFRDIQLACVVLNGKEDSPDAIGGGTYLVWFNSNESNPFDAGDPLIDIPYDQWAFHQDATNKLFGSDGEGVVFVEGVVLAGSVDTLAVLDTGGIVSLKASVASGTNNEYFAVADNGTVVMKG